MIINLDAYFIKAKEFTIKNAMKWNENKFFKFNAFKFYQHFVNF